MVIQRGKVGRLVNALVVDMRKVMEPFTAQKLKALKSNVLKDFLHVAGPYGVTHLLLLSKSEVSANLRICRLPRGPTITFHILSFSLCKDVVSSLKHASCGQRLFTHPPLVSRSPRWWCVCVTAAHSWYWVASTLSCPPWSCWLPLCRICFPPLAYKQLSILPALLLHVPSLLLGKIINN